VLLVDANITSRRILSNMLLHWQMEPVIVNTVHEAANIFAESQVWHSRLHKMICA